MTQPSPIPWRTVGVVGSVEIISGSEYGSFVPVAKVHGFGPGPGGAPNLAEAWSNARFIADARNKLPEIQDAMMQARDTLAAVFRVCSRGSTFGDELLGEIRAAGVIDGFGSRLQDAIEATRKMLAGVEA